MTGQCQNPGCERLATVIVRVFGHGDRQFCYSCEKDMTDMGMGLRRVDASTRPEWVRRMVASDRTGSVA